jgi:hypothetical protein
VSLGWVRFLSSVTLPAPEATGYRQPIRPPRLPKRAPHPLMIDTTPMPATICRANLACSTRCPLARVGRICPDPADFLDELAAMGLSPADVRDAPSLV